MLVATLLRSNVGQFSLKGRQAGSWPGCTRCRPAGLEWPGGKGKGVLSSAAASLSVICSINITTLDVMKTTLVEILNSDKLVLS